MNSLNPTPDFASILSLIEAFAAQAPTAEALERHVVETIAAQLPTYNWVGFYMLAADNHQMLDLGPFVGAPTQHTRIPVSEGICGAAVALGETIVIDNVRSDPRYLACSLQTQSEIVVPIRVQGQIVGEIDIDSHNLAAFQPADRAFVEQCALLVGNFLQAHPA